MSQIFFLSHVFTPSLSLTLIFSIPYIIVVNRTTHLLWNVNNIMHKKSLKLNTETYHFLTYSYQFIKENYKTGLIVSQQQTLKIVELENSASCFKQT